MVFRKLYWVTERVSADRTYELQGVYTSIPNLLKQGFPSGMNLDEIRLSLTKLDCDHGVLASWLGSDYSHLAGDLRQYVELEDFTAEQADALVRQVNSLRQLASRATG